MGEINKFKYTHYRRPLLQTKNLSHNFDYELFKDINLSLNKKNQ